LARKYYKKACKKNHQHSLFNLAVIYKEGEGVTKNENKAIKLFKRSMNLGNIKALNNLGAIYCDRGDYYEGKKFYKQAMQQGCPLASYNLGKLYVQDG
jgi:TPR repeat protein